MKLVNNCENVILSAKRIVEADENSVIRLNANGGNSILIVCEPIKEVDYIDAIRNLMTEIQYEIIDLNEILCNFVCQNREDISGSFELLKGSIHQIFKIPDGEEGPDLFNLIIQEVKKSFERSKIPVLINSGALYGSGIDNIHIMENELIMKASLPLIVLYPATKHNDKLMFLGIRPASKYRCMIIE